jgi:cobalt-zinc-cadmium efflux system protein
MHHNHHGHSHSPDNTAGIKAAFWLNFAFTILEIGGGLWTNSVAIVADAVHDLGDSLSLGLAWFLEHYAQKSEDDTYAYGYRRYSLLGALLNTLVLIVGGFIVLSEAVPRLLAPEPTNAPGMIGFAVVGILVNGLAVLRVKKGQSFNTRVVAWHLFEDVLGWVAVLIVGITLLFSNLYILDPILSLLVTLYILYNVIRNLKQTLAIFLQAVPGEINLKEIKDKISAIAQVQSIHHTHLWSLDGEHHVLTTHVVVADDATKTEILQVKRDVLAITETTQLAHSTIEIEYEGENCRLKDR